MRRMGEGGLLEEGMRLGRSPKWAGWLASSSAGGAGTFSTSAWYVVSAENVQLNPLTGDISLRGFGNLWSSSGKVRQGRDMHVQAQRHSNCIEYLRKRPMLAGVQSV